MTPLDRGRAERDAKAAYALPPRPAGVDATWPVGIGRSTAADRAREQRLRRTALRQGVRLERSRQREKGIAEDGRYFLIEGPAFTGRNWGSRHLLSSEFGSTLDEIEAILCERDRPGSAIAALGH